MMHQRKIDQTCQKCEFAFHFYFLLMQQCTVHLLHDSLLLSPDSKNPNATAMTSSDNNADNIYLCTVSTVDNVCKISKVNLIMNATSTTTSSSTTMKKRPKDINAINIKKTCKPLTSTNKKISSHRNDTMDDNYKEKHKSKRQTN